MSWIAPGANVAFQGVMGFFPHWHGAATKSSQPKVSSILFLLGSGCRTVSAAQEQSSPRFPSVLEGGSPSLLAPVHNQQGSGETCIPQRVSECGALIRAHLNNVANGICQTRNEEGLSQGVPPGAAGDMDAALPEVHPAVRAGDEVTAMAWLGAQV